MTIFNRKLFMSGVLNKLINIVKEGYRVNNVSYMLSFFQPIDSKYPQPTLTYMILNSVPPIKE